MNDHPAGDAPALTQRSAGGARVGPDGHKAHSSGRRRGVPGLGALGDGQLLEVVGAVWVLQVGDDDAVDLALPRVGPRVAQAVIETLDTHRDVGAVLLGEVQVVTRVVVSGEGVVVLRGLGFRFGRGLRRRFRFVRRLGLGFGLGLPPPAPPQVPSHRIRGGGRRRGLLGGEDAVDRLRGGGRHLPGRGLRRGRRWHRGNGPPRGRGRGVLGGETLVESPSQRFGDRVEQLRTAVQRDLHDRARIEADPAVDVGARRAHLHPHRGGQDLLGTRRSLLAGPLIHRIHEVAKVDGHGWSFLTWSAGWSMGFSTRGGRRKDLASRIPRRRAGMDGSPTRSRARPW